MGPTFTFKIGIKSTNLPCEHAITSAFPIGTWPLFRFSDLRVYATNRFTASPSGDGGMASWFSSCELFPAGDAT